MRTVLYIMEEIRHERDYPPSALEDLRRFHAYGWLPGPIAHVLNRRHGLCLTAAEVKQLCREMRKQIERSKFHAP